MMDKTTGRSVVRYTSGNASVGRILLLVTYLFVGSVLALSAASSAWAAGIA